RAVGDLEDPQTPVDRRGGALFARPDPHHLGQAGHEVVAVGVEQVDLEPGAELELVVAVHPHAAEPQVDHPAAPKQPTTGGSAVHGCSDARELPTILARARALLTHQLATLAQDRASPSRAARIGTPNAVPMGA